MQEAHGRMKPQTVQQFYGAKPLDEAFGASRVVVCNGTLVRTTLSQVQQRMKDPKIVEIIRIGRLLFRNRTTSLRQVAAFRHFRIAVKAAERVPELIAALVDNIGAASYYPCFAAAVLYNCVQKAAYNALKAAQCSAMLINQELDSNLAGIFPLAAELHMRCQALEPAVREAATLIHEIRIIDQEKFERHIRRAFQFAPETGIQHSYAIFNDICGDFDVCYYMSWLLDNKDKAAEIGIEFDVNNAEIKNQSVVKLVKAQGLNW